MESPRVHKFPDLWMYLSSAFWKEKKSTVCKWYVSVGVGSDVPRTYISLLLMRTRALLGSVVPSPFMYTDCDPIWKINLGTCSQVDKMVWIRLGPTSTMAQTYKLEYCEDRGRVWVMYLQVNKCTRLENRNNEENLF